MNLAALDLNLLQVFRALMVHRSATKAGQQIGLSQSAVSNALNRLRYYYKDPLFRRTRDGMEPTTRAYELADPILDALSRIEATLPSSAPLDPRSIERRFHIALADFGGPIITNRLVEILTQQAPRVELTTTHMDGRTAIKRMERAEVDLAVGVFSHLPTDWPHRHLFVEHSVVALRADHPRITQPPTMETFIHERHVRVAPYGFIDRTLADRGLSRRVAASAELLMVPFILERTDLLAILPLGLVKVFQSICDLRWFNLPMELPPYFITLLGHPRSVSDRPLGWLSRSIEAAASKVRQEFNLTSPPSSNY